MRRYKNILLVAIMIVAYTAATSAKITKLTGKIVAYDMMRHASKTTSGQQNQEVIVLETSGAKQKYVKVMFSSFGTTQVEQQYFDGTLPLTVDVFRDHSCDEDAPAFVSRVSLQEAPHAYLLTDAFKAQPPAKIKILDCYVAIYKKKK